MDTPRFWSRLGHWLARPRRMTSLGGENATSEPREFDVDADPGAPISRSTPLLENGASPAPKSRWLRSGSNLERLEEEYRRVVNLMDAIQTHLTSQADRSERMAGSLDRLAENLVHTPEAFQKQSELLSTIKDEVAADAASTKRVEQGLSQLPRIADAQRETMVSIGRQLDSSIQSSERVTAAIVGFQEAVTRLGEATGASVKAIEEMRCEASTREERVASLIDRHARRFVILAWLAIGLGVIIAVAASFVAFR